MSGRLAVSLGAALAVLPAPILTDRAIVIDTIPDGRQAIFGAQDMPDVGAALPQAGFETVAVRGDDLSEARAAPSDLRAVAQEEDRIVLYLSGGFLRDDGRTRMTEAGSRGRSTVSLSRERPCRSKRCSRLPAGRPAVRSWPSPWPAPWPVTVRKPGAAASPAPAPRTVSCADPRLAKPACIADKGSSGPVAQPDRAADF